jgi:hypothetical protein
VTTHGQGRSRDLVDVLDPLVMASDVVSRQSEQLDSSLSKESTFDQHQLFVRKENRCLIERERESAIWIRDAPA